MSSRTSRCAALLAPTLLLAAHAAAAQPMGLAGIGVASAPSYDGSDERRTRALPLLDYRWANGWFAGTVKGIGYNASRTPGLEFGPRLTVDFGRKERRSAALRGMGDVDAKAELGAFVEVDLTPALSLGATLQAGGGDGGQGVRSELEVGYAFDLGHGLKVSLGAATTLANQAYVQSYFGVTAAQSAASGYAVYTPQAGAMDVSAKVSLRYPLAPRVMLTAAFRATQLQGDAKASPLVRKASSVSGLLALGYAF
jgi:outer membrane scaffolding protein for murein synthesis (MipA/OmpV family)